MFAVISKKEEFYPAQISGSFVRTRVKNPVVELQAHQFTFQPQFEAQRKRSLWQVGWGAFWSKTWCLWRQPRTSHISYFVSRKDFSRVLQGVFCFFGGGSSWNKTILYIRTKIPLHYNNIFDKVFANFPPHWIAVDKLKLRNQYGQSLQPELACYSWVERGSMNSKS